MSMKVEKLAIARKSQWLIFDPDTPAASQAGQGLHRRFAFAALGKVIGMVRGNERRSKDCHAIPR